MRFDLVDLRLMLHVAEAASITHGAARSGMALASASERIRAMEATLGTPLLERKRRGVALTPAGAALVRHARVVVQQLEQMAGELGQHAKGLRGHIRLLSNTAATREFLGRPLAHFLLRYRNVDVELEERSSPEIVRAIAAGRADIGIVADAVDTTSELETFAFAQDRLVLVTPRRHPLARRCKLAFRETLSFDFVGLPSGSALQDQLEDHAARAGQRVKLRVRLPDFDAMCRVVESGIAVAVVPRTAAERCRRTMAIAIVPLSDPWAVRDLRVCVRSVGSLPAHAQALVEQLAARPAPA
jgi:molybdate transport repressor ModE-like protein